MLSNGVQRGAPVPGSTPFSDAHRAALYTQQQAHGMTTLNASRAPPVAAPMRGNDVHKSVSIPQHGACLPTDRK